MYAFTFSRPTTVRQAANVLAKDEDAKLLAGGHTLLPTMKLRLAHPTQIVENRALRPRAGADKPPPPEHCDERPRLFPASAPAGQAERCRPGSGGPPKGASSAPGFQCPKAWRPTTFWPFPLSTRSWWWSWPGVSGSDGGRTCWRWVNSDPATFCTYLLHS